MAGASETADLYISNGDTVLLLAILILIVFSAQAKSMLNGFVAKQRNNEVAESRSCCQRLHQRHVIRKVSPTRDSSNLTYPRLLLSSEITPIYSQSLIKVYTIYADGHFASKTSNAGSRVLQVANPPPNLPHRPLLSLSPTLSVLVSRRPNSQIQATT